VAYQIKIKKSAEKELEKLPLSAILILRPKIIGLAKNPFSAGYKKLKGFKNLFRIRIGDYRIIFSINHNEKQIEILKIGDRKNIYE